MGSRGKHEAGAQCLSVCVNSPPTAAPAVTHTKAAFPKLEAGPPGHPQSRGSFYIWLQKTFLQKVAPLTLAPRGDLPFAPCCPRHSSRGFPEQRAAGRSARGWRRGGAHVTITNAFTCGGGGGGAGEQLPGRGRARGAPHREAVVLPGVFLGVGLLHLRPHQADGLGGQRPWPLAIPLYAGLQRTI